MRMWGAVGVWVFALVLLVGELTALGQLTEEPWAALLTASAAMLALIAAALLAVITTVLLRRWSR
jgi:predicted lysophospholipase L1 biosynthesis ABC-type transport system permease subunit